MYKSLFALAQRLWPELGGLPKARQLVGIGDVFTAMYSLLLGLVGLNWLAAVTETGTLAEQWPVALLMAALIWLFGNLSFFFNVEFRADRYGNTVGSFDSMMVWTACFIFGATSLWLIVLIVTGAFLRAYRGLGSSAARWDQFRNLTLNLAGFTLPYLFGLQVYDWLGGNIPIGPLTPSSIAVGLAAIMANYLLLVLLWLPYFFYLVWTQRQLVEGVSFRPVLLFFVMALTLPSLAHPFAILASSLYGSSGLLVFLFFTSGLIVVAVLVRRFSRAAESNRLYSRQLLHLEALGRAILRSSPENGSLDQILADHVPFMFPARSIAIWLFLEDVLYRTPEDWQPELAVISAWMSGNPEPRFLMPGGSLPWAGGEKTARPLVALPIISQGSGEPIGGILVELRLLTQTWTSESVAQLGPVVQALADQISAHLQNVAEYQRSVELQQVQQELRLAAQIQSSFLPREIPNLPGWQLAVSYQPAGELSGDFFDLIQLSDERLGLVIADVAGKGLGASLYMALCRTLIRTFALEYPNRPDIVFSETNDRILQDASAQLFITTLYGVLDLKNSRLTYCNAGHNPGFLFGPQQSEPIDSLPITGIPIGIEPDRKWERREMLIEPGGALLLYSDGITEGQNNRGELFGLERLQQAAGASVDKSSNEMQETVLAALSEFVGDAPQFDDITMLVLRRDV